MKLPTCIKALMLSLLYCDALQKFFYLFIFFASLFTEVNASWSSNPQANTILQETSVYMTGVSNPAMCEDGQGGFFVAFQMDFVTGEAIFIQHVNAAGEGQWQSTGFSYLPNATMHGIEIGNGDQITLTSDGIGGAIIVWHESDAGTDYIKAQHVNAAGTKTWLSSGVVLSTAPSSTFSCALNETKIKIVSDHAQGIFLSVLRENVCVTFAGTTIDYDFNVLRVDANGSILWNQSLPSAYAITNEFDMIEDGNLGVVIAWTDSRNGTLDIYAQRISSTGVSTWNSTGLVVCAVTGTQSQPDLVLTSNGEIVIVWSDNRNGNDDIYAQKINSSGVTQWLTNGVVVCNASGNQEHPAVEKGSTGDTYIVFEHLNTSDKDLRIQKLNNTGSQQWSSSGVIVCNASDDQFNPVLISDDYGGVLIAWEDSRNTVGFSYVDIYAQRINTSGNAVWASNGIGVSTSMHNQTHINMISNLHHGALLTWDDSGDQLLAQSICEDGQLACPSPEITITSNGLNIADGKMSSSKNDGTNFGTVDSVKTHSFVIKNTGSIASLDIYTVFVNGSQSNDFTLSTIPSSIPAGDSAILHITYSPQVFDHCSAVTLMIGCNDTTEALFDFALAACGTPLKYIKTEIGTGTYAYNGDGSSSAATNLSPKSTTCDRFGNVFIADYLNHRIRKKDINGFVTTIAGTGANGFNGDGIAVNATINNPAQLVCDSLGNVYFTDYGNNRIRKITPTGFISTVAGNGSSGFNGDNIAAVNASIGYPFSLAMDALGNILFTSENRLRKINASGIISTLAGNDTAGYNGDNILAVNAQLSNPQGIAIDNAGNIFICDAGNVRIRKIHPNGMITTIAGNGNNSMSEDGVVANNASISYPGDLLFDAAGNLLFTESEYTTMYASKIRGLNANGYLFTLAGIDSIGFSGDGASALKCKLKWASDIALDPEGFLYVCDEENYRVRKIGSHQPEISVSGNGIAIEQHDVSPTVVDHTHFGTLSRATSITKTFQVHNRGFKTLAISSVFLSGVQANQFSLGSLPNILAPDSYATLSVTFNGSNAIGLKEAQINIVSNDTNETVYEYAISVLVEDIYTITTFAGNGASAYSGDGGQAVNASLNAPTGVTIDKNGNIFIADRENHVIRKVTASGIMTTIAGTGMAGYSGDGSSATFAQLNTPTGVAVDTLGNLYIADQQNHRVRKINSSGIITTIAGTGVPGYNGDGSSGIFKQLNQPTGVAVESNGIVYIADYGNNRIRKISSTGFISTIAGNGIATYAGDGGLAINASLYNPSGIAVGNGGKLYVADNGNHRIRKIESGNIITIAGTGIPGNSGDDGPATNATLNYPYGICYSSSGDLFISDQYNSQIRKVNTTGMISRFAGNGNSGFSGDGGNALNAQLSYPGGLCMDSSQNMYIADVVNNRIRKLSLLQNTSSTAGIKKCTFNGITDSIVLGNLGAMPVQGSISFIMNWNGTYPGGYPNVLTTNNGSQTASNYTINNGISFQIYFGGMVAFFSNGSTFQMHQFFPNGITPNTNYHIVLTWNQNSNTVKGYVNAVKIFEEANTNWPSSFTNVVLGVGSTSDRLWPGTLDQVAFWDGELNYKAIYTSMHNLGSNAYPPLRAIYTFDNNTVNGSNQLVINGGSSTFGMYNGYTYGTANTPVFDTVSFISNINPPTLQVSSNLFCPGTTTTFTVTNGSTNTSSLFLFNVNGIEQQIDTSHIFQSNSLQNGDVVSCVEMNNVLYSLPAVLTSNAITMITNCNAVNTCNKVSTTEEMFTDYQNDFNSTNLGTATLTHCGPQYAGISNGELNLLTSSIQGLRPQLVIPPSGKHSNQYQIGFDVNVSSANADGFSYSFGLATNDTCGLEVGNWNHIKVCFVTWGGNTAQGIYLTDGPQFTNWSSFNSTVLAYSNNVFWMFGNSHVDIDINPNGQLSLWLNGNLLFNVVQLTSNYTQADRSNWSHSISGRTGLLTMNCSIDNLQIKQANNKSTYSLGDTIHLFSTPSSLLHPSIPIEWKYNLGAGWNNLNETTNSLSFYPSAIGQYIFEAKVTFLNGNYCTTYDTIQVDSLMLFADVDGDGFGNPMVSILTSGNIINGYVKNNDDCNDQQSAIYPGAIEVCGNGIDDNCNGLLDEYCNQAEALHFDGINDYVALPNGGGLSGSQTGTIEMWVKWNGSNQDNFSDMYGAVCARQSDGVFSNQIIALNGSNPNTAKIIWRPYYFSSTPIISPSSPGNGWNHLAITYSSGNQKMYVNGVIVGSSLETGYMPPSSVPLTIGAWIDGAQCFSNANIDEVRLWNYERSASEIASKMNCEIMGSEPGLVGNYHFNQGIADTNNMAENTLVNETGNANGSLVNFALTGSTSNWTNPSAVVSGTHCDLTLNLKLFIEGYYIGNSMMASTLFNQGVSFNATITDSIEVELRNASTLNIESTQKIILNADGTATSVFAPTSGFNYIVVKHRNGLQTWSAEPIAISSITNYDFTTAANKAFGNNMIEVEPGVWAFYSGDLNQDENIDLLDLSPLEIDINNFSFGYFATDINGDGNVDLLDNPLVENNINSFVFSVHP